MQKKSDTKFPNRFLWGVSTSAHQVEGNNHNQWTEWEKDNAKSISAQSSYQFGDLDSWPSIEKAATNANNYISGKTADHYNRYSEDFSIAAKQLHMNAFRFSIEWSRVEPKEGVWDAKEIEHYKQYIQTMIDEGLEPIMTLFHFTLPVWFAEKGGFEKRGNVKDFMRFVEKIMTEVGKDVRYVLTINEMEVYTAMSYKTGLWPPNVRSTMRGFRVLNNLIYAHKKASKLIHRLNRRHKVSCAVNVSNVFAGDDALLSRTAARIIGFGRNGYVLRRIRRYSDFIGVNYYFSDRVYGYRIHNADNHISDLGWNMKPSHLEYALEYVAHTTKLPILITENGVADEKDQYRSWWLNETIKAMKKSMKNGVTLIGYLHWSLLDNFEWREGAWPRFGLVEVNYKTYERSIRPSAKKLAAYIKSIKTSNAKKP